MKEETTDDHKKRRKEKNKEAAMRSRLKKKFETEQLKTQIAELSHINLQLRAKCQEYEGLLHAAYTENMLLKNSICYIQQESSLLKRQF